MSLLIYKLCAGILIFVTSLLTVAYPVKVRALPTHHRLLELGDAFASGIFLGAALFHMLPDAISDFAAIFGNPQYPFAEFFCAGGFLLLLFFERLSERSATDHTHGTIPYVVATIIIIHSLIEGTVLGTYTTLASASIIFIAIIAHKGSESFALAITLNRSNLSLRNLIILLLVFSLMTPLGIGLGTLLSLSLQYKTALLATAGFNAFAAGTFLYISTLHHINHHHNVNKGEGLSEFFALVGGLCLMGLIAV